MKHLLLLVLAFVAIHVDSSRIPELCQLPEDAGEGQSFIFAFHYNAAQDQCNPFVFKGNGGNANRFVNEIECIRNCSVNAENIYPMDAVKACHFKKAIGGCGLQLMRYYYDSVHDKCKKFIYSGCIGNGNRFFDHESCNATCAGIHDDGDEPEEDEPDTPIAIICGVLLAVIVLSIIIPVIVLTVKSKKKGSKKKTPKERNAQQDPPLSGIEMQ
ncbi:kunitz-type serine protease inhibitor bitisilin-3 isoform X1 [Cynoglossus semilaevis]|nr:kunitz-type serine protease inhibitor bitisilin-3-like isoform X1 [Cynoglossus semilaevis]XP_024911981.1 kunitz-type serine protease inhibitor bitisilin-3-like isoform X1 [Cynoglossus semilaevis]